jgi:nucleoside phosphorylase
MIILTFAHKGEAAEFIRRKHTLAVDFYFSGLFRDDEELLLITGEGVVSASDRLSSVCAYFGEKVRGVINLGIAGTLRPELEINQIYGIRQVIHELEHDQFNGISRRAGRVCVTVSDPVSDPERAEKLRIYGADCVDMEAWGLASVCNSLKIPFQSYKLISDQAGMNVENKILIKQAPQYSRHLFDFYKKLDLQFLVKD